MYRIRSSWRFVKSRFVNRHIFPEASPLLTIVVYPEARGAWRVVLRDPETHVPTIGAYPQLAACIRGKIPLYLMVFWFARMIKLLVVLD